MTGPDAAIRRANLMDRLDAIQEQAERWQRTSWDAGEVEEATFWFEIAGMVRVAVLLLERAG